MLKAEVTLRIPDRSPFPPLNDLISTVYKYLQIKMVPGICFQGKNIFLVHVSDGVTSGRNYIIIGYLAIRQCAA